MSYRIAILQIVTWLSMAINILVLGLLFQFFFWMCSGYTERLGIPTPGFFEGLGIICLFHLIRTPFVNVLIKQVSNAKDKIILMHAISNVKHDKNDEEQLKKIHEIAFYINTVEKDKLAIVMSNFIKVLQHEAKNEK